MATRSGDHRQTLPALGRRLVSVITAITFAVSSSNSAWAADPPRPLSPSWFATRGGATGGGQPAVSPQGSNQAVQESLTTLRRAAGAITAMQTQQSAARSAAQALQFPDGLGAGGLQASNTAGWQNAKAPAQAVQAGRTQVTVAQTAPRAVMTWSSFNIGAQTDLVFDQSAGGSAASSWVALNRVLDPTAQPSRILGSIRAAGQVFVINRNGVIFGANSQVNVGSLLVSTADFAGANGGFPAGGIYSATGASGLLPALGGDAGSDSTAQAAITVQAGAQIATPPPASLVQGGGYVMLLGGQVSNAGSIATPRGQTVLAAGQRFILTPGYSSSGSGDALATTLGTQVAVGDGGLAANSGLITASQGDITLAGLMVQQAGVALSTTTVAQRGTIHLLTPRSNGSGSVTLAPGSLTMVVPALEDTSTALNSQRGAQIATSVSNNAARLNAVPALDNVGGLGDRLDLSRIEVTTGGTVTVGTGAIAAAQSGQIAVQAVAGRIFIAADARLDVSGVAGVSLPASANILTVNIQPTEMRDSPANRDAGKLAGKNVYVDLRNLTFVPASTTDPKDRYYTPGGLLEVGGYVSNLGHTIAEWSTIAGTITLASGQLVAQPAAVLNIAGGTIDYQGGYVPTSWLTASNGQIYNIAKAPATVAFTGLYGGFTQQEPKWGVSQTFGAALAGNSRVWQDGYTVGRDAGQLTINAPTVIFEASLQAGVVTGAQQTAARPASVPDPFTLAQTVAPLGGSLRIGRFNAVGADGTYPTGVQIGACDCALAAALAADSALPAGRVQTAWLSADMLSSAGIAGVQVSTAASIDVLAPVFLAPGGSVSLTAPHIQLAAPLSAPAATVSIGNRQAADGRFLTDADGAAGVAIGAAGAILAGGLWNNRALAPGDATGAAFQSGGSVTLTSSQGLDLAPGSVIDVRAGASVAPNGTVSGARGGSVTLIADDPRGGRALMPLRLGAAVLGNGFTGGGTLSVTAPRVLVSASGAAADGVLGIAPSLFSSGFGSYDINGLAGITVAPGTRVAVLAPVLIAGPGAAGLAGGSPIDAVATAGLGPLFAVNRTAATLTQRPGAGIILESTNGGGGGDVSIGAGAALLTDPGQSVVLRAYGSLFVDGAIVAHGGSISLVNTRFQDGTDAQRTSLYAPGLAIRVGGTGRLDASGIAVTQADNRGRPFGIVQNGGSISLGGLGGTAGDGTLRTTAAQILIRPGAVLTASGAQGLIDPTAGRAAGNGDAVVAAGAVIAAGNGGTIALSSYNGIYLDGTLRAAAGGTSAAGGTLSVTMETPIFNTTFSVPAASELVPRVMTISAQPEHLLPLDLAEGAATPAAVFGQANISAEAISSGGFGTLALSNRGLFAFVGKVALHASQAIRFDNGIIADSATGGAVRVVAPYVHLGGLTSVGIAPGEVAALLTQPWTPPTLSSSATFLADADTLDVVNDVRFGTGAAAGAAASGYAGFKRIDLISHGDLRFLPANGSLSNKTSLVSNGDIAITAGQLYPAAGASALVVAGYDYAAGAAANPLSSSGRLTIAAARGPRPAAPLSIGGSLTLAAGEVVQGGVVRAPLGSINLGVATSGNGLIGAGTGGSADTTRVRLLAGSETSVSALGLTLPYGGTSDGVSYNYNGVTATGFAPAITLASRSVIASAGAVLDMRGGGTLSGGGGELQSNSGGTTSLVSQGFVAGRGGSTDFLVTPLSRFNPNSTTAPAATLASNPVYAILPGYTAMTAPLSGLDLSASYYGSLPALGQRVDIAGGVPGLPAGTYTLLPSYYALLPGAFRIELSSARPAGTGAAAVAYQTWQIAATLGIADTRVQGTVPITALVTPGTAVRSYAQYNEQSYSDFQIAQASTFQRQRPLLPRDAGSLVLSYATTPLRNQALSFAGQAEFDASEGGFGGTVLLTSSLKSIIEITGPSGAHSIRTVAVSAASLDRLAAPRLVIGGGVTYSPGTANSASFPVVLLSAVSGGVTIDAGATVQAAEVFLIASSQQAPGAITVQTGATIDTTGQGAPSYDSARTGLSYDVQRSTALMVSNGLLTLSPINLSQRPSSGPLTIADGATLRSEGSVIGATEQAVSIGVASVIGSRSLQLSVPVVNIGVPADPNVPLPSGLTLDAQVLARLIGGDPANGVPGLQALNITASGMVGFYGSVDLSTATGGLQTLILNTPAIYGQGGNGDRARLTVDTLEWNGVASSGSAAASILPRGVVAGGAGSGTGTLDIETRRLVLGYADGVAPSQTVRMDRVIAGFSAVRLVARDQLEFNNNGSLSVYASLPGSGVAGTGGAVLVSTPRVVGSSAAALSLTAGGSVTFAAPAGALPAAASDASLGATLTVRAPTVSVANTLSMEGGRIALTATGGDLTIGAGATLSAAAPATTLFDQTRGVAGGLISLESTAGNVIIADGSALSVASAAADAGSVSLTAWAGMVKIAGSLDGTAPAGAGGQFILRTGTLNDFAALNAQLNAGGFTAARRIDVANGDIDVTGTVRAQLVAITASGGRLTVSGTIDASGASPGSIALAARDALTIAGSAILDAHATQAHLDSDGVAIASANRGTITLSSTAGTLSLATGAALDLSNATGTDFGQVSIYAPRRAGAATTNDVAIDASGPLVVKGAASIALYGMATYQPDGSQVTQGTVMMADFDSQAFMSAATQNPDLLSRLAGLTAYAQFHLRPGVALVSAGDLTLRGEINLMGMRYQGLGAQGQGTASEPGSLIIRAGGNLNVYGSLSDGFLPAPEVGTRRNPDDQGWVVPKGVEPAGQSVTVPNPVRLDIGTRFLTTSGAALGFPITITGGLIRAQTLIPGPVALAGQYVISGGGWIATSAIRRADGSVLFAKGALIPAGTRLAGVMLDAGAILPFTARLAPDTVWPAGAPLSAFAVTSVGLSKAATVPAGATIPGGTIMHFVDNAALAALRPISNGIQGSVIAIGALAAGGDSWSMRLVGGANLASADNAAVLPASQLSASGAGGNITLADTHYVNTSNPKALRPALSVIRTGTGDLALNAGGDIVMDSLFGVYTAGVQSPGVSSDFQLPRGTGFKSNGQVLATGSSKAFDYNALLANYQAWFPIDGGNLAVTAQGSVGGNVVTIRTRGTATYQSDAVGNWLWRQGGSPGQATAWWINFASYVDSTDGNNYLEMAGFAGFGTLGGGNVTLVAGGDAGHQVTNAASVYNSTALDVVAAASGRVIDGAITSTGGGDVTVQVAGRLNGATTSFANSGVGSALFGVIGAMRGTVNIDAGAIGRIAPASTLSSAGPLIQATVDVSGGPLLLLADASARIASRGDLVLGAVIDPARVPTASTTPWSGVVDGSQTSFTGGGRSSFTLWRKDTAVTLVSAGGDVVPATAVTGDMVQADMNLSYPPTLRVAALRGDILLGGIEGTSGALGPALELAPAPMGQLELLAHGSVNFAALSSQQAMAVDISGAPTGAQDLATPFRPAFQGTYEPAPGSLFSIDNITNKLNFGGFTSLFAFTADTPATAIHAADTQPARIYAATGDIVNLGFGETWRFLSGGNAVGTWYLAAKPATILAGRDIIAAGNPNLLPSAAVRAPGSLRTTRNLVLNLAADDVTVVSAGRDVFYANIDIAGPGTLEVMAGRNLYQGDHGSLFSLGQVVGGNSGQSGGASILVMAGLADNAPDWNGFSALYLGTVSDAGAAMQFVAPSVSGAAEAAITFATDGAGAITALTGTLTDVTAPIGASIKRQPPLAGQELGCIAGRVFCDNHSLPAAPFKTVAHGYDGDLVAWMQANAGFVAPVRPAGVPAGTWASFGPSVIQASALRQFDAMPLYQRLPFLLKIYDNELAASGLEQTGALGRDDARYAPTSASRLSSLARGRAAHAALEPDPAIASPSGTGDAITLFGGSGISTGFGGDISVLAPGGRLVLGLGSLAPPTPAAGQPAAGLITFGSGNIDIATYSSVLLGQSRIFTTFGGSIDIWSEGGDINAGTGSKTTSIYQPPRILYSDTGAIALSPTTPTTGAGIATLAPVSGIPPGDVVLVVEIGVIDTGEAGIRSSGRTSFTGAVVGTGGVTSAGGSFGLPSLSVPNVGALAAASSGAAAAAATAGGGDGGRRAGGQQAPGIITVEVVSFGGDTFE